MILILFILWMWWFTINERRNSMATCIWYDEWSEDIAVQIVEALPELTRRGAIKL